MNNSKSRTQNSKFPPHLLYLVAFIAGMTTLGIELTTSRLIGAVLGTSNIVWAVVIALTLFYLMIGYLLGGRWADRSPYPETLFRLLIWTAFSSGLLPVLMRPLMLTMASAFLLAEFDAIVLGIAGITVMALFAVPMTLLGCVPLFVVRLVIVDTQTAGNVAGRVYAVSTLGSILGTFAPVLALIPAIGSAWTSAVFTGALMLIAFYGLSRLDTRAAVRHAWMPIILILALLFTINGPIKPPPSGTRLLYEAETPYNYVQVVEVTDGEMARQPVGTRLLLLNEGQGVHSVYHPDQLQTFGTWDMFLAAPYFNAPPYDMSRVNGIAVIGLAAGTIARQHTAVYGPAENSSVQIDGVEIDPGIVEAGQRFFAMTMPNLNVIVEDGRYALSQLAGDYDLIAIDAYRVPYIPWQLTTVEFFTEVRARLAPDGVVMINVGRASQDRRLIEAMTATMLEVFPAVHTIDVPYSFNTMLAATQTPTTTENLAVNLVALPEDAHPFLRDALTIAYESLVPTTPSDLIFTDDRAPVETLINAMVLEFILGEGNLTFSTGE